MNTLTIDDARCIGCGSCFKACFVDVFRWDAVRDRPIVAYPEDCVECNKCELACPVECLQVQPDYAGITWPEIIEEQP